MNPLLDPGARLVIGHRGAASAAPENTMTSFERALAAGADALEFDVHITADGHAVVIHDPTLDRTTNARGAVSACTLEELRRADAGARFTRDGGTYPFRGKGEVVPTVSEVLSRFPATPLLIELKTPAAADALRRMVEQHRAQDRCVIGSFDDAALAPFRAPPWHASASRSDALSLTAHVLFGAAIAGSRYEALSLPTSWRLIPLPVRGIARAARAAGKPLHIWVVDDPGAAVRLWDRGVCGIITNDPAAIVPRRDRP